MTKQAILKVIKTLVTIKLKTTLIVLGALLVVVGTAGVVTYNVVQENKAQQVAEAQAEELAKEQSLEEEVENIATELLVNDEEETKDTSSDVVEETKEEEEVVVEEVKEVKEVTYYAISTVNVRSAADANSSKLGSLSKGSSVPMIGIEGDWTIVKYNGTTGYISSKYLSVTKPVKEVESATKGKTTQTTTPSTNTETASNGQTTTNNTSTPTNSGGGNTTPTPSTPTPTPTPTPSTPEAPRDPNLYYETPEQEVARKAAEAAKIAEEEARQLEQYAAEEAARLAAELEAAKALAESMQ